MTELITRILFRNGGTLEIALPPHEVIRQLSVIGEQCASLSLVPLGSPTQAACLISVPDIVAIGALTRTEAKQIARSSAG